VNQFDGSGQMADVKLLKWRRGGCCFNGIVIAFLLEVVLTFPAVSVPGGYALAQTANSEQSEPQCTDTLAELQQKYNDVSERYKRAIDAPSQPTREQLSPQTGQQLADLQKKYDNTVERMNESCSESVSKKTKELENCGLAVKNLQTTAGRDDEEVARLTKLIQSNFAAIEQGFIGPPGPAGDAKP
jgi:hypothetical protein